MDKPLASGAILTLQLADFDESMALLETVLKECVGVKLEEFDMETLFQKDLNSIKDLVCSVVASKSIKDALWRCMSCCKYQGLKATVGTRIEKTTFNDPETRSDYFPVAGEVAVFNLSPFLKGLSLPSSIQSVLKERATGIPLAPSTG